MLLTKLVSLLQTVTATSTQEWIIKIIL